MEEYKNETKLACPKFVWNFQSLNRFERSRNSHPRSWVAFLGLLLLSFGCFAKPTVPTFETLETSVVAIPKEFSDCVLAQSQSSIVGAKLLDYKKHGILDAQDILTEFDGIYQKCRRTKGPSLPDSTAKLGPNLDIIFKQYLNRAVGDAPTDATFEVKALSACTQLHVQRQIQELENRSLESYKKFEIKDASDLVDKIDKEVHNSCHFVQNYMRGQKYSLTRGNVRSDTIDSWIAQVKAMPSPTPVQKALSQILFKGLYTPSSEVESSPESPKTKVHPATDKKRSSAE